MGHMGGASVESFIKGFRPKIGGGATTTGRRETNVKVASHDDRDLASTSVAFLSAFRSVRAVWVGQGKRPYVYVVTPVASSAIISFSKVAAKIALLSSAVIVCVTAACLVGRTAHDARRRRRRRRRPMDGSITTVESVGRQPRERPTAYDDVCSRRKTVLSSSSSLCSLIRWLEKPYYPFQA